MISETTIKAAIRRAETGKKLTELRDGGGRGEGRLVMVVRLVAPRVATEWYAVWYRKERRKMAKLGAYPAVGLADARKLFREDYAPEISAGRDPTGPRKRRAARGLTVLDLFEAYIEKLKAEGKKSAGFASHILLGTPERDHQKRKPLPGAAAVIGEKRAASEVTAADIRKHLSAIHARGAVVKARDARAYIGAAFNFGLQSANDYTSNVGLVDWGLTVNPVAAVPTDKSEEAHRVGERHLTPAEVRVFWTWLSEETESTVAEVPRLIICTGQRVTEILRISDVAHDETEAMLDWSKTKNGLPHAAPLPRQGCVILAGLRVNRFGLYFPHLVRPDEPASIDAVEKVVHRFLASHPDFPHFTPRDLRRTWKTLSGAAGISKEVRDRIQNHARADVSSRHYDRYDYLVEKRAAMKVWETYLDRILAGDLDNPVARIPAATA